VSININLYVTSLEKIIKRAFVQFSSTHGFFIVQGSQAGQAIHGFLTCPCSGNITLF